MLIKATIHWNIRLISILVIVMVILSASLVTAQGNNTNPSRSHTDHQLTQVEIIQPNLFVKDVLINQGELPVEGEMVIVDLEITNEDDFAYLGLELIVQIEENVFVRHGPKPVPEAYNKSLSVIAGLITITQQISFRGNFGQYKLTASLSSNGTILPNSINVVTFQVISQPIGSITSLVFAIISIVLLLFVLIPIPWIIEKLKPQ
ncbi:MAG: hypothetical protein HeimC2_25520 [Candidatus Heimdallarchaeota archaeon LC_2]|nr:MAG: hypothetical protein HeimC2_25520 [Candidatus Heimdallarchaeota archaeon LC_2]